MNIISLILLFRHSCWFFWSKFCGFCVFMRLCGILIKFLNFALCFINRGVLIWKCLWNVKISRLLWGKLFNHQPWHYWLRSLILFWALHGFMVSFWSNLFNLFLQALITYLSGLDLFCESLFWFVKWWMRDHGCYQSFVFIL